MMAAAEKDTAKLGTPAAPEPSVPRWAEKLRVARRALASKPHSYATIIALILATQIALLVAAALKNLNVINVDAISYLRIAQYYLDFNTELAVTGYWGPLFSWILVPFLALGAAPLIAARFAMGISAVIFLLGSLRIFHVMLPRTIGLLSGVLTAMFTIPWSVAEITPDLLVSGLLLLAISDTISADTCTGRMQALRAGLLYGLAYLAKSVALPVSIGLAIIIHGLRIYAGGQSVRAASQSVMWTLSALALVALPWVLTLSRHYGSPTFSTSGSISHAVIGPGYPGHVLIRSHLAPPPGRITSWEDPDPKLYAKWSPFADLAAFKHQVKVIVLNLRPIMISLKSFDLIGFGLSACILGFLFPFGGLRNEDWRLFCGPIIGVTAGVYLPVFASEPRYYIVCYPLLITAAFGFVKGVSSIRLLDNCAFTPSWRLFRRPVRASTSVAASLVTASFFFPIADDLGRALRGSESSKYALAQRLADTLRNAPAGPLASVGKPPNPFEATLYAAYLSGRQFYGNRIDVPSLDKLTAIHDYYLVVEAGTVLDDQLRHSAQTRHILLSSSPLGSKDQEISVYFVTSP
jgi:hypothetical protein